MDTSYVETRVMVNKGDNGINKYCIIARDESSFVNYPVYAVNKEEALKLINKIGCTNMQLVMEVYDYSQNLEEQFNEMRTWRI